MVDILKNWIATILFVGIFFTFIKMIIPNTKLKKYIYSLIGIVTLITLMLPITNKLSISSIEEATQEVLNNIDESSENKNVNKNEEVINNSIRDEMSKKIKEDLKQKLSKNGIITEMISVILDEKYNIQKITIKILKQNNSNINMNIIFKIVNENYGVLDENVIIEEV